MKKFVNLQILLVFLFSVSIVSGQEENIENKKVCYQRAEKILEVLEKSRTSNVLFASLKNGNRGGCIHQTWMDSMRQSKIKQAWFLIEYKWKNGKISFNIANVSYFADYFAKEIEDKSSLQQIAESKLSKELRDVVLEKVRKSPFAERKKNTVAQGNFGLILFDDEALPDLLLIN